MDISTPRYTHNRRVRPKFYPLRHTIVAGKARVLLREHLNVILGFAALLAEDEALNGRQRRFVDNIHTAGKSLLHLLH